MSEVTNLLGQGVCCPQAAHPEGPETVSQFSGFKALETNTLGFESLLLHRGMGNPGLVLEPLGASVSSPAH